MLLRDDPRPESPPPPPTWMGVVSGLCVLEALVALIFRDYQIAGVGIIIGNVMLILLAVRRHRERQRKAAADVAPTPHPD